MSKTALDILFEVVTILDLPGGLETVQALSLGQPTIGCSGDNDYRRLLSAARGYQPVGSRVELTITPIIDEDDVSLLEAATRIALDEQCDSIPTNLALLCGE
jgi:hypothetical protein